MFSAVNGYSDRTWVPAAKVRVCLDKTVMATNCFLGFYMAKSDVCFYDQFELRLYLETFMQVIWLKNV